MKIRTIKQKLKAMEVTEGAGVSVHRTIGTPALKNLDPFLLLDHFSSSDPDDYIAGFPDHPHRGFVTLTYMLDGHMLHQDSMGNRGDLRAGGAQWMKAASGVIHSEMPQQSEGLMRGFQLWINLPAAEKMSDPEYQEYSPAAIPLVKTDQVQVRVVCGDYNGQTSVINDPITRVKYLDVSLEPGSEFIYDIDTSFNSFIYVFEGDARCGDEPVLKHTLLVLGDGDRVVIHANGEACRFVLIAGLPVNEPVVQYGPFVMNTREEIERAFNDYRDGKLVSHKAVFHTDH
ncbi:MAG: pirin family protein [Gammaproteobacteria bacterium]|nr:pirin family protein [Gammaproteobacteria bacterium]